MRRFDAFVIGGGGTGSEIAYRLGERSDLRVGLAERDRLGGECNHYGCVPTKVMLRSARISHLVRRSREFGLDIGDVDVDLAAIQQRARDVVAEQSAEGTAPFDRLGVSTFLQEARLAGERRVELADGTSFEADRIVLATGSEATAPAIPGLAEGPFWTNREAIWTPSRPPASLAVIGTGPIGVEFAQIYARLGSTVTALEVLPRAAPQEDPDASTALVEALEAEGIVVRSGVEIERAERDRSRWRLSLAGGDAVEVEEVLVATGRRPVFDGHDLVAAGVDLDEEGRPILSPTLRTTAEDIWAAGDATGELLFTHVGTYEAGIVVDDILGRPRDRDYRVVPKVTFSDPEVASVGLTELAARDDGYDVVTSVVPIADNERSRIDGMPFGVVKLVADGRSGALLGGHIVAEEAGAMIHEVVVAMAGPVPAPAVAEAVHAYPTLSESVKDAFLRLAASLDER